ncbi:hypothetical protein FB45DRAFT_1013973 [Roridomyces roridus]|uniref:Uncharacterized protein n=1 Tax=Roridomyces roridus TaxID=1738132 RepID=A0AAD7AXW5_9AGAR|nr:hypothetical protein FB45DRAFT_1013973 [Roridomyces roridus]
MQLAFIAVEKRVAQALGFRSKSKYLHQLVEIFNRALTATAQLSSTPSTNSNELAPGLFSSILDNLKRFDVTHEGKRGTMANGITFCNLLAFLESEDVLETGTQKAWMLSFQGRLNEKRLCMGANFAWHPPPSECNKFWVWASEPVRRSKTGRIDSNGLGARRRYGGQLEITSRESAAGGPELKKGPGLEHTRA